MESPNTASIPSPLPCANAPVESGAAPQRLLALDAFRGFTIALMIVVNNPGSWGKGHVYGPLLHAPWNGWTPTDLVFPFFLFIVGVAMTFSFRKRLEHGAKRLTLLAQVGRRSAILILLGLIMAGFPDPVLVKAAGDNLNAATIFSLPALRIVGPYILFMVGLIILFLDQPVLRFGPTRGVLVRKVLASLLVVGAIVYFVWDWHHFQESALRVPGVLQRIGLCYFFASLIVMTGGMWWRAAWLVVLLGGYWALVTYVHPPQGYAATLEGPGGLLHDWIDVKLLGQHLYRNRPDPEGLLSTLPAIGTVLAGVLTGHWLQTGREKTNKLIGLFLAANVALVLGLWIAWVFPLNKKIWTSSYVLATAGVAMHFLAVCYWLIDIKGVRKWAWPFVVFGSNAIVVYFLSSSVAKVLAQCRLTAPGLNNISIKTWLYTNLLVPWAGNLNGSLAYPLIYIALWLIPMYVLYRLRIFVRI